MSCGYCIACNEPIPVIEDFVECKRCATRMKPCAFGDDVKITLAWRQICVLAAMAERASLGNAEAHMLVAHIALTIEGQHPERGHITLTTKMQAEAPAQIAGDPKKARKAGGN